MNRRILLVDMENPDIAKIKQNLSNQFDFTESSEVSDTIIKLGQLHKFIKAIIISMNLFREQEYSIMKEINNQVVLRHIPIICIDSADLNDSERTQAYLDAFKNGALFYMAHPINYDLLSSYLSNVIAFEEYSYYSNKNLPHSVTLNYENNMSNGTFWNPKSLDSITMHTSIGAACLIEYVQNHTSIVRTNDDFTKELFGSYLMENLGIENFFETYLDTNNWGNFQHALKRAVEDINHKTSCEVTIEANELFHSNIHLRMSMRLIEKINERALIYCVIENDTDKYEAINREMELISQLQTIIQNYNGGITIAYDNFDTTQYTYTNTNFYMMFGYTKEEFEKQTFTSIYDLILPEYLPEVKRALRTLTTQMTPIQMTYQARKQDGTIITVRAHCNVQFMKSKSRLAYISFYEDITNLIAAENRIHELNEKLAGSEVFIQLDLYNRRIESYHSIYEPDTEADDQSDYKELLLRQIYIKEKKHVWDILSYQNLLSSFRKGNNKLSVEYRRHMPDGKIRWFAATAILVSGGKEDVIMAFIYTHDIDDKKKIRIAKDKIMDSEVSDITIINIKSGICRNVKLYDSATIEQTGLNGEYEKTVEQFIDIEVAKEDRERCRTFFALENLVSTVEKEGKASTSFWIIRRDGMNVRKNGTATYLDSTHEDLLLVGRDITGFFEKEKEQQMALQQAVEMADFANKAKTDFLSRMSHDMRTPLNAILGVTELAIDESKLSQITDYLKSIDVLARYLLGMINDTLDLGKIESGKMELHREVYPLEEFQMMLRTIIQPIMDARHITFDVSLK